MENIEDLRCIHRHTIKEHPICFLRGAISAQTKRALKDSGVPWYNLPGLKVGYIDIEVTNLVPEFGSILTWAIKEKGSDVYYDIVTKKEALTSDGELRVLNSLLKHMRRYAILVGYYSGDYHFDLPYIRTKALHYGLDFPDYGEIFHFDLYQVAKAKLKLRNYKLETILEYLKIGKKTQLKPDIWRSAMFGDPKSLEYVLEHNIADVESTELLHDALEPFAKWTKKSI